MTGIKSFAAYVPLFRLNRGEFARAWKGASMAGEKAVANYDEDSLTMAAEAAQNCLTAIDSADVAGLFFATTTSPYAEKSASSILSSVLDLKSETLTMDITDSLRGGTSSLLFALGGVQQGNLKDTLLVCADCRLGMPGSDFEQIFGDASAAILVGTSDLLATFEGSYTLTDPFTDVWRKGNQDFVNTWEDRFVKLYGFSRMIEEGVKGLLKKYELTAADFAKVVIPAPDVRSHQDAVRRLGFKPPQVQDPLLSSVGNAGAAHAFLVLASALEEAKAGDRILLANYGDGCDLFILRATDLIDKGKSQRGMKHFLNSKLALDSYEKYITLKGVVEKEPPRRPPFETSLPTLWRDRKSVLSLYGGRCKKCGTPHFPLQRICFGCKAKDNFEEVRLAGKKGEVFTFTKDNLFATVDPPQVMTVVEIEGGFRIYCQMTDRNPDEVRVGMPVEMTFRKIHEARGLNNYFWKCRPVR
jgi:3-hydroxy-3-methylglutaryl CoA synthase